MTKRELIRAEINLKSRWSQAIYQQQLAKEKPERKEIAEEAANIALGYMYAIADILQVTKGVSNADSIVRNESRSYEDVLLDYGIDDEDLILSLEALESSANDAMEALFLQTGGGY